MISHRLGPHPSIGPTTGPSGAVALSITPGRVIRGAFFPETLATVSIRPPMVPISPTQHVLLAGAAFVQSQENAVGDGVPVDEVEPGVGEHHRRQLARQELVCLLYTSDAADE